MKQLKTQTIVLSSLYFGGVLSYNIFTLYTNSTEQLKEYRKTKQHFKNDLESVINGCQKNWFDNLLLSLFWPIRLPFKILPIMILYFNSNETNNESFIQYEVKKCINIKNMNDSKKYIKTIDKMKNEIYESNKENTEFIKETIPIKPNDADIFPEDTINQEILKELSISDDDSCNEETSVNEKAQMKTEEKEVKLEANSEKEVKLEANSEKEVNEVLKSEKEVLKLDNDIKKITDSIESIEEKFNFGNFTGDLFDFNFASEAQFNFTAK
jgi:hypothetical protein